MGVYIAHVDSEERIYFYLSTQQPTWFGPRQYKEEDVI